MGRTYKRDPNGDDFDDPASIDADDERDLLEWMARPNEARRATAARRERPGAIPPKARRGLLDDWEDIDFGADARRGDPSGAAWR